MWKVTLLFLAAIGAGVAAGPYVVVSFGGRAAVAATTPDMQRQAEPVALLASNMAAPAGTAEPQRDAAAVEVPAVPPAPAPPATSAPAVPDPLDDPQSFWDAITKLRRTGGLWAAIGVAVAAIGGAALVRMRPKPGEPDPDPSSWRARSLAILGVAVMLGGAGADLALGLTGIVGFLTALITAGALVWRAFNPPRGAALEKAGGIA